MASSVKEKKDSAIEVGHLIGGEIKYYDGPTQAIYNPSNGEVNKPVSYTHLPLPTILLV